MRINYIVVRKRSRKAVKRILGDAKITPPAGPFYTGVNYTFTVTTSIATPTYTWSPGSSGTIVSGQGTTSAVISFSSAGQQTISCTVAGATTAKARWSGTITTSGYAPSLDYSDSRNSMYRALGL